MKIPAFFRSASCGELTPEAKTGVAVNQVSLPTAMVDIDAFYQVAKDQQSCAEVRTHA
jgi:hypothetical protein